MSAYLQIDYIQTCLPDYLTDLHCREDEWLIGVSLCGQDQYRAAADIADEFHSVCDAEMPWLRDSEVKSEAIVAARGVDFRVIDENGERIQDSQCDSDEARAAYERAMEVCEARAWFVARVVRE